jgi:hypothetical protein
MLEVVVVAIMQMRPEVPVVMVAVVRVRLD